MALFWWSAMGTVGLVDGFWDAFALGEPTGGALRAKVVTADQVLAQKPAGLRDE